MKIKSKITSLFLLTALTITNIFVSMPQTVFAADITDSIHFDSSYGENVIATFTDDYNTVTTIENKIIEKSAYVTTDITNDTAFCLNKTGSNNSWDDLQHLSLYAASSDFSTIIPLKLDWDHMSDYGNGEVIPVDDPEFPTNYTFTASPFYLFLCSADPNAIIINFPASAGVCNIYSGSNYIKSSITSNDTLNFPEAVNNSGSPKIFGSSQSINKSNVATDIYDLSNKLDWSYVLSKANVYFINDDGTNLTVIPSTAYQSRLTFDSTAVTNFFNNCTDNYYIFIGLEVPVDHNLRHLGASDTAGLTATYNVTATDLGGVTVSVPESITLAYDSENAKYANNDNKVYVYGWLDTGKKINVATNTSTTFTHRTDNTNSLTGAVSFGTNGVASWSNEQILNGATITANRVGNTIGIEVTDLSNIRLGNYDSTLTFTATTVAE